MKVPLTIRDFLDRAVTVYGDRVGRRRRARSAGAVVGRRSRSGELAARAQAQAAGARRARRRAGERVAMVSHNSARLLTSFFGVSGFGRVLVPINFRLHADEVSYIVEHSGASVLLVDPELERRARPSVECKHRFVIGAETDAELSRTLDGRSTPSRSRGSPTRTPPPPSTTRAAPRRGPRACS